MELLGAFRSLTVEQILPVSLYVRVTALYTLQPDLQSLDLWEWNTKTAYRIALDTVRIGERKA